MEDLISAAESLIHSLCHDKEGWEYSGSEELAADPWGAERVLVFHREEYVVCYVGFRSGQPLYVLQRVE